MASTSVRSCSPTRRCTATSEPGAGARQRSRTRCAAEAISRRERSRAARISGTRCFRFRSSPIASRAFSRRGAIRGRSSTATPDRGSAAITSCSSAVSCSRSASIHMTYAGRFPEVGVRVQSPRRRRACSSRLPSSPEASAPLDLASANAWLAFLSGTVSSVGSDVPGAGSDVRLRCRDSEQRELQPEQCVGVSAGQLALEANLHAFAPA